MHRNQSHNTAAQSALQEDRLNAFIWRGQLASTAKNSNAPINELYIAVKDNIAVKDIPMTCASKILQGYKPDYNATIIELLLSHGAVITGKTNMDEFAMGQRGDLSCFGPVLNVYCNERVTGGSSSGSAAAVASGLCDLAIGSDTGGSVRLPAAYNNIIGFKPSYGALSRFGLTAFASSLDCIGLMSANINTIKSVFNIIKGADSLDRTSIDIPDNNKPLTGKCACLSIDSASGICSKEALEVYKNNIEKVTSGFDIDQIELENIPESLAAYHIISSAEAASNLARYDGLRYGLRLGSRSETRNEGFGPEVKRRIEMGNYVLSTGYREQYYSKALRLRNHLKRGLTHLFMDYDFIITPTAPDIAPMLNTEYSIEESIQADIFLTMASLTGLPAISIPAGFSSNMPLGLQLIGGSLSDIKLLDISDTVSSLL